MELRIEREIGYKKELNGMKNFHEQRQNETLAEIKDIVNMYKNKTEQLRDEFDKWGGLQNDRLIEECEAEHSKLVSITETLKQENERSFMAESIFLLLKKRKMQEIQMIKRISLMEFFTEFCDVRFYDTFMPCTNMQFPTMTDTFPRILEKLLDLLDRSYNAYPSK